MRPIAYPAIFALILLSACAGQLKKKEKGVEDSLGAVLKETVATGDTGFYRIAGFKKDKISDNLCQHWERNKYDGATSSVYVRDENEKPINAQYNFFKDGSVLENGRHHARVGTWQMVRDTLVLSLNGNVERKYHIAELNSKDLRLTTKSEDGKILHLNLAGNQLVHKNMLNDPFTLPIINGALNLRNPNPTAPLNNALWAALNSTRFFTAIIYTETGR
jgi:hypothetical protein